MPLVRIDLLEGRPREKLKRLIRNVSEVVAATLDTPIERVRVVIDEVSPDLWGIAGVPASETDRGPGHRGPEDG
jgi:4-oxalocrotonate tautomerase